MNMKSSRVVLVLLASLGLSTAFRLPQHDGGKTRRVDDHLQSLNRVIIASTIAILGWSGGDHNFLDMNHPPPAYALQEKNEVLCNTGFFTNVGAWYCTDIGNIGDEGASKPLSAKDEVSVDSLMSKFNFDDGSSSATEGDSSSGSKQVRNVESGKRDDQK
jgi:hypothetical protein